MLDDEEDASGVGVGSWRPALPGVVRFAPSSECLITRSSGICSSTTAFQPRVEGPALTLPSPEPGGEAEVLDLDDVRHLLRTGVVALVIATDERSALSSTAPPPNARTDAAVVGHVHQLVGRPGDSGARFAGRVLRMGPDGAGEPVSQLATHLIQARSLSPLSPAVLAVELPSP
ncbi:hypothetical protein OIE69_37565 [Actinacidiphila glaucinigra]|uniref:hypothetical protein n=1 Tax=Actinacidiphila glaucinigra TaxID=235986 RepID=UPI002DD8DAAB|nr:hypothetical protein [Actinacidiphila glaucinigra]WSD64195.1 hypothetical protein OIE69_37565 [Actinacidiphila glaucinigra]